MPVDEASFYALSYTWGPTIKNKKPSSDNSRYRLVICDTFESVRLIRGEPPMTATERFSAHEGLFELAMSHSLEDALHNFIDQMDGNTAAGDAEARPFPAWPFPWAALQNSPKFWIDAICINQEDEAEKRQQIFMMGEIYANSDIVVVWLGGKSESLDTFFGSMNMCCPSWKHCSRMCLLKSGKKRCKICSPWTRNSGCQPARSNFRQTEKHGRHVGRTTLISSMIEPGFPDYG